MTKITEKSSGVKYVEEFSAVHFSYGKNKLFNGIQFDISQGRILVFLGGNGSGKTTLLRLAAGILQPSAGSISVGGENIAHFSPTERAAKISYLAQYPHIPHGFSVLQCVIQGRFPYSTTFFDSSEDINIALSSLGLVGGLRLKDRDPTTLSGGEYQRVALARMLAQNTEIMLLDEPGAHLDISHTIATYRLLKGLASSGKTICITTHDLNLAAAFADDILMLKKGELICSGGVAETLTSENIKSVFDIDCEILPPSQDRPRQLIIPRFFDSGKVFS